MRPVCLASINLSESFGYLLKHPQNILITKNNELKDLQNVKRIEFMKHTDEENAQTAMHEGLIQSFQVNLAAVSRHGVASHRVAALPSAA